MAKTFYKHVVIVHGIGEQQLNETGVDFMNEFCRALPAESGTLTVFNLVSRVTDTLVAGASIPAYVVFTLPDGDRYFIGFSEVYWQPVTKGYLAGHHQQLPVPVFTWVHSINSRIHGDARRGQSLSGWRETLDNAETLLGLAAKLAAVSKKSKVLSDTLRDFLGDVQMYAEDDPIHAGVNDVFRAALGDIANTRGKIAETFDSSEIYIVAHSEGTVVAWKSLTLAALEAAPPAWLDEIKGMVTLGSPIDKHRVFWGAQNFPADPLPADRETKIPLWNFWDYSDPVASSLDAIFPAPGAAENHQFLRIFDGGFARYPIPGLAHIDYWKDVGIYHRIIQEVMRIPAGYSPRQMETGSRWWGHWWLMRTVDVAAYWVGRAAEAAALVYLVSRLLTPVRNAPWLAAAMTGANRATAWPLDGRPWANMAIWILGSAAIWKLVWDVFLPGFQDRALNLRAQLRVERAAMTLWVLVPVLIAALGNRPSSACGQDCAELKDYIGWGAGLCATVLIWKLHTTVQKGLLQLWRYGQGTTMFKPAAIKHGSSAI